MKWFAALPAPVRGVLWMLLQAISMVAMMTAVRALARHGIPGHESAFFRGFVGVLVMLPWLIRAAPTGALFPREWRWVGLRTGLASGGVLFWFLGLGGMPISDVVAVQFTHPLFVVAGAALLLGESVGGRRWRGVAIVLASAMCNAGVQLCTKRVAGMVPGAVLAFYMNLLLAPIALVAALPVWVWPAWADLGWIVAIGVFGALAHIFLTRAFTAADASLAGPVDFARLPFGALAGWLLFDEFSDGWTWLGAGLIIASVLWITRRESRAAAPAIAAGTDAGR
jgi:drug/metabolite transporter (DMT)-like permease